MRIRLYGERDKVGGRGGALQETDPTEVNAKSIVSQIDEKRLLDHFTLDNLINILEDDVNNFFRGFTSRDKKRAAQLLREKRGDFRMRVYG